ncbi:MAG: hypothetical protein M3209_05170 [Acidobacteriota bacterium]|nr:hypothetical protein [Acidobacteriota bacterium]
MAKNKAAAATITAETKTPRITKKDQIVSLFLSGMTNLEELAKITGASNSYIGSVLQDAGLMTGYFDLYTTTANPMNVYSKFFVNKLGFKNEETALRSVEVLENAYRQFDQQGDRAGQHHALEMALIMFDRARFTGKRREAEIFRDWLVSRLEISEPETTENFEQQNLPIEQAEGVH